MTKKQREIRSHKQMSFLIAVSLGPSLAIILCIEALPPGVPFEPTALVLSLLLVATGSLVSYGLGYFDGGLK